MLPGRASLLILMSTFATACANAAGDPGSAIGDAAPPDAGASADSAADVPSGPSFDGSFGTTDAAEAAPPMKCAAPPTPADPMKVTLAPTFAGTYTPYVLGPVPGVPPSLLGGCVLAYKDPNTLYVATSSESQSGAIYAVPLKREPCGHIVGFAGNATLMATTPYVDANLLYGPNHVLFYSMWPVNQMSELLPNTSAPAYTVMLSTVGVGGGGPGGIGFVPPNLQDPGGLRAVTWPDGYWYHLTYAAQQQTYAITGSMQTTTLPNGPGGFAYVPAGSPKFAKQSLITDEWNIDKVVVYEVDPLGDPVVATRTEFFTNFPKPWGAYFEDTTGDFLFLDWGGEAVDQVYIVQGFAKPPPPPPPPK
jgi:hypothetical protein